MHYSEEWLRNQKQKDEAYEAGRAKEQEQYASDVAKYGESVANQKQHWRTGGGEQGGGRGGSIAALN